MFNALMSPNNVTHYVDGKGFSSQLLKMEHFIYISKYICTIYFMF